MSNSVPSSRPAPQVESRPAPPSLQEIVDRPSVGRSRPQSLESFQPIRSQSFQTEQPIRSQSFLTEQPIREESPVSLPEQPILPARLAPEPQLPARLTPIRIQTKPETTTQPQTERPSRLQFSAGRPGFRSPFRGSQARTTSTTTTEQPSGSRFRPFSRLYLDKIECQST